MRQSEIKGRLYRIADRPSVAGRKTTGTANDDKSGVDTVAAEVNAAITTNELNPPTDIAERKLKLARAGRDRRGRARPATGVEGLGVTTVVPSRHIDEISGGKLKRTPVAVIEAVEDSARALGRENIERVYGVNKDKYSAIPLNRSGKEMERLINNCALDLLSIPEEQLNLNSVINILLDLFGNLQNRVLNDMRAQSVLGILKSSDEKEIKNKRLLVSLRTFISTSISGNKHKDKASNLRFAKIKARVEMFPHLKPKITAVGSEIRKIPTVETEKALMAISTLLQTANPDHCLPPHDLKDLCSEILASLKSGREIYWLVADLITRGVIDAGAIVPKKTAAKHAVSDGLMERKVEQVIADLEKVDTFSLTLESGVIQAILHDAKPNEPLGDVMNRFAQTIIDVIGQRKSVAAILAEYFGRTEYLAWYKKTMAEAGL